MMSTKALIGVLLAGTVGILDLLFVHLSGDSSSDLDRAAKARGGLHEGRATTACPT